MMQCGWRRNGRGDADLMGGIELNAGRNNQQSAACDRVDFKEECGSKQSPVLGIQKVEIPKGTKL